MHVDARRAHRTPQGHRLDGDGDDAAPGALDRALRALPDGIDDAKRGHSGFFWAAWGHPEAKTGRLREGLISVARIILLGLSMDVIYQMRVIDHFYPLEALVMAILLAVIPYFLFRGIIERVARAWFAHKGQ